MLLLIQNSYCLGFSLIEMHENFLINKNWFQQGSRRYLSNNAIALIADESENILHRQNRLLLSTNLKPQTGCKNFNQHRRTKFPAKESEIGENNKERKEKNYFESAILLNQEIDPASSRHGLGAHNPVLPIRVPHFDLNGLRHGRQIFRCSSPLKRAIC